MSKSIDHPTFNNLKPATQYISTCLAEPVQMRIGKQGVTAATPQTIPQLFSETCKRWPQSPALVYRNRSQTTEIADSFTNTAWTIVSYEQFERNVEKAALALLHVGITANSCVSVLSNNCPEWCYVELGVLRVGGVVSGIYLTSSPAAVKHVLETSLASVCVVEDTSQMAKVKAVRAELPRLKAVIQLQGTLQEDLAEEAGYYLWADLMTLTFDQHLQQELLRLEKKVAANQCALLIFTSGTTGFPKAAMISHDSIICNARLCLTAFEKPVDCTGVTISYLPLNHIAAQLYEVLMTIQNGDCVYYADPDALKVSLIRTLQFARPTRIFGVPRVYEKIQEQLATAEENTSRWWRYVTAWAKRTLLDCYLSIKEGEKPKATLKYMLASLIMQPYKAQIGLDRCEHVLTGSAPLSAKTKEYFLSMDILIGDMYGASEAGGIVSFQQNYCHVDSSGRLLKGIELKIDHPNKYGQGEICVRGRCTMMGYLNEPAKTNEAIDRDDWLHTGDVGLLYDDGCLLITGRIKEIIITAGGENIPPVYVENLIKAELPCLGNALLVGNKRKYLTVLLTFKTYIDDETGLPLDTLHPNAVAWLQSQGLDYTLVSEVLNIPAFTRNYDYKNTNPSPKRSVLLAIEKALSRANQNAQSRAQRVQKFALLPHDFTTQTGELGPTLKCRRSFVCDKYTDVIEQLYRKDN